MRVTSFYERLFTNLEGPPAIKPNLGESFFLLTLPNQTLTPMDPKFGMFYS